MAVRLLRGINLHHTRQILSNGATWRNIFVFKLVQNLRLLPFLSSRLLSTSPSRLLSTSPSHHLSTSPSHHLSTSPSLLNREEDAVEEEEGEGEEEDGELNSEEEFLKKYHDPKDRTRQIPVEISIKYMESVAFKKAYGDSPVWTHYRRNHKRQWAPRTRETCIRQGHVSTGSPCPVCRDEYLVLDYRNTALLNQFIDPYTGKTLATRQTNICQKKQRLLEVEVERARDHGLIQVDVPQVEYDYSLYNKS